MDLKDPTLPTIGHNPKPVHILTNMSPVSAQRIHPILKPCQQLNTELLVTFIQGLQTQL
jgi:hypothetical protein